MDGRLNGLLVLHLILLQRRQRRQVTLRQFVHLGVARCAAVSVAAFCSLFRFVRVFWIGPRRVDFESSMFSDLEANHHFSFMTFQPSDESVQIAAFGSRHVHKKHDF